MDPIAMYIVNLHNLLGHETARRIIGGEKGDPADCILCQYEKGLVDQATVIATIGTPRT